MCSSDLSVRLPTAALQFPLGHPAVATVIPGTRAPEEVAQNVAIFAPEIPADFWAELKHEGLLRADAVTRCCDQGCASASAAARQRRA